LRTTRPPVFILCPYTTLFRSDLAERVWEIVINWDYFLKDTIGKQLVREADSVAANLSEGFGRFFYKENRQLCYYSRGSLFETKTDRKSTRLNSSHVKISYAVF